MLIVAIVSGYVDACAFLDMTPHRVNLIEPLLNSVVYVPLHLVGVGLIVSVARCLR